MLVQDDGEAVFYASVFQAEGGDLSVRDLSIVETPDPSTLVGLCLLTRKGLHVSPAPIDR